MPSRQASGRFVLRLPPGLHRRLRRIAETSGLSLNSVCVRLLSEAASMGTEVDSGSDHAGLRALAKKAAETYGDDLLGVVLFGSAARGEARADSDVDLLLVLAPKAALRRGLYRRWDELFAEGAMGRELNAHFVHLPEAVHQAGSLWLEVAIEGRVVMDREGRVARLLVALRRAIAAGRFVRGTLHGQPCWRRAA